MGEGCDGGNGVIEGSKSADSRTAVANVGVEESEPDIGDEHSIKVSQSMQNKSNTDVLERHLNYRRKRREEKRGEFRRNSRRKYVVRTN
jgi:hypothetical protein